MTVEETDTRLETPVGAELEALFEALERVGMRVGPRERVSAAMLVAELIAQRAADGPSLPTLADFRNDLAPLLARSTQERADFFRVFDVLAPPAGIYQEPHADAPARAAPRTPPRARPPGLAALPWRRIGFVLGGLALTAVLLLGAFVTWRNQQTPVEETLPAAADTGSTTPVLNTPLPEASTEARDESIVRLEAAAARFDGAPTLEELSGVLATDSPIGWSAAAYAQRLHELTALPRATPLALVTPAPQPGGQRGVQTWAALALALDRIEQPGQERRFAVYAAQAQTRLASRGEAGDPFAAQVFAELMAKNIDPRTWRWRDKGSDFKALRNATKTETDAYTIERALAVAPAPMHRIYPDAAWSDRVTPAQMERASAFTPWFALALPLLLAALWCLNNLILRKAFLRRRSPQTPPLHTDLVTDAATRVRYEAGLFQRIGQKLGRRTARTSDRLDVDATIRRTIGAGGMFVDPVFARTRALPEYLVLMEKRAAGDQDFERLRTMMHRLRDLVILEVYTYQTEPSQLEPEAGGRAVAIERLMAAHPDHRLLVLGSGASFLDPATGAPLPSVTKLMHWERRAMLTPVPLAEWGHDEFTLARELAMPIGRATADGLLTLADLLGLDGVEEEDLLDPRGDGLARPLPEALRLSPERFLYASAPYDRSIDQIVQDLRNYLDPPTFEWLCMLAIYPAIQWDLTLYLGVSLAERAGGDASAEPLYREDRISALTQLPWLREGAMPNWLRTALIARLTPDRGDEARGALQKAIEAAQLTGDKVVDDAILLRIAQEPRKEALEPENLYEDEVLLDFMSRGRIEDFELPQTRLLDRFLPQNLRHRVGLPELAAAGVATVYAVAAFALAPKPADGALVTGAWLPIVALAIGALIAASMTNVDWTYKALRNGAERIAATGLVFAGAIVAHETLPQLVGSVALNPQPVGDAIVVVSAMLMLPLARAVAAALGIYGAPPSGGLVRRATGIAIELALVVVLALCAIALTESLPTAASTVLLTKGALVAAGVGVFALGWVVAHYAPDRLPAPRRKRPGAHANWFAGAARVALALVPIAPAIAIAWHESQTHTLLAPSGTLTAARAIAVSPDGGWLATGGADGVVRVFDARAPQRPVSMYRMATPIVRLALARDRGGTHVASVSNSGAVALFTGDDARPFAPPAPSPLASPPLVAVAPDGAAAVAYDYQNGAAALFVSGAGAQALPLPKDAHGPVTALIAAGPRQFAFATNDGALWLLHLDPTPTFTVAPALRLPGRARLLKFDARSRQLRAIGDDGTVILATINPGEFGEIAVAPSEPTLSLGRAVVWLAPRVEVAAAGDAGSQSVTVEDCFRDVLDINRANVAAVVDRCEPVARNVDVRRPIRMAVNASFHTGRAYAALGRLPQAIGSFERATALDPNRTDVLMELASALAKVDARTLNSRLRPEPLDDAIVLLTEILRVSASKPPVSGVVERALLLRGTTYRQRNKLGDGDLATRDLNDLMGRFPTSPYAALARYALADMRNGNAQAVNTEAERQQAAAQAGAPPLVRGESRGLADINQRLGATAVMFSTLPGDTAMDGEGRNSPFAAALIAQLNGPRVTVFQLLNAVSRSVEQTTEGRQRPWINAITLPQACIGGCVAEKPPQSTRGLSSRGITAPPAKAPTVDRTVRLALVIGNGAYEHTSLLANPANDAQDVSRALRGLGFNITTMTNASRVAMSGALQEFAGRVRAAPSDAQVVIYFAGQGFQIDGENFIIPVDANIQTPDDARFQSIGMDLLLGTLQSRTGDGFNLVIIDACRDNPFAIRMR